MSDGAPSADIWEYADGDGSGASTILPKFATAVGKWAYC